MNAFAVVIQVSTRAGAHRAAVIEAINRCLEVGLVDGEDPSPIEGVSVMVETATPYDTQGLVPAILLV